MKMRSSNGLYKFLTRVMFLIVLVIIGLIVFKANPTLKSTINQKIFNSNFNFAKINELYEKYFGSVIPEKKENVELVSGEILEYTDMKDYKDGAELTVSENYPISAKESGIVIFSGDKEGYGKTVVIQTADKIEMWYGNLENLNISLYDYVKKGTIVGSAKGTKLYMAFQKDGAFLNYKKYI